jgi:hypothetical protein
VLGLAKARTIRRIYLRQKRAYTRVFQFIAELRNFMDRDEPPPHRIDYLTRCPGKPFSGEPFFTLPQATVNGEHHSRSC